MGSPFPYLRKVERERKEEREVGMASEKKRKREAKSEIGKKRKRKSKEEAEEKSEERSSEALRLLESATGLQLSSLELESLRQDCILEVPHHSDVQTLGKTVKAAFGGSWREHLCEESVVEGKVNAGSPAVLIIASSALRCIELLRFFSLPSSPFLIPFTCPNPNFILQGFSLFH